MASQALRSARVTLAVNAVARKQFRKFKRVRALKSAPAKAALPGGEGVAFSPEQNEL